MDGPFERMRIRFHSLDRQATERMDKMIDWPQHGRRSNGESPSTEGWAGRLWIWFWAGFTAVFIAAMVGVKIPDPSPNYGGPRPLLPLWNFYCLAVPFLMFARTGSVTTEGWMYFFGICLAHLGAALGGGAVSAAIGYAVLQCSPDSNDEG